MDRLFPSARATCYARGPCRHIACFQARLEATAEPGPQVVHWEANSCASHIGNLVLDMADRARASRLTSGQLTVFAIDPAATQHSPTTGERRPGGARFAFSTIQLQRN